MKTVQNSPNKNCAKKGSKMSVILTKRIFNIVLQELKMGHRYGSSAILDGAVALYVYLGYLENVLSQIEPMEEKALCELKAKFSAGKRISLKRLNINKKEDSCATTFTAKETDKSVDAMHRENPVQVGSSSDTSDDSSHSEDAKVCNKAIKDDPYDALRRMQAAVFGRPIEVRRM